MGKAKTSADALRAEVQATVGEMEALRDEIKLRVHLAGKDLEATWKSLDPEYLKLRDAARDVKDEALHALRDGLFEVRKRLHALRAKLDVHPAP